MRARFWLIAVLCASIAFNVAALSALAYCRSRCPRRASQTEAVAGAVPARLPIARSEQAKAVRAEYLAKAAPLQSEYEAKSKELARLAVSSESSDAERVDTVAREVADLHYRIQLLAAESLRREAEGLTPAEREAYTDTLCQGICPRATGDCACEGAAR
jgi:hypothetical protein